MAQSSAQSRHIAPQQAAPQAEPERLAPVAQEPQTTPPSRQSSQEPIQRGREHPALNDIYLANQSLVRLPWKVPDWTGLHPKLQEICELTPTQWYPLLHEIYRRLS